MSDRPLWSHFVQWGLWFIVMTLVMGWIARSRKKATPSGHGDTYVLTITKALPIIGYVFVGLFLAAAVASALSDTAPRLSQLEAKRPPR